MQNFKNKILAMRKDTCIYRSFADVRLRVGFSLLISSENSLGTTVPLQMRQYPILIDFNLP
jgi:hypothetical protein